MGLNKTSVSAKEKRIMGRSQSKKGAEFKMASEETETEELPMSLRNVQPLSAISIISLIVNIFAILSKPHAPFPHI